LRPTPAEEAESMRTRARQNREEAQKVAAFNDRLKAAGLLQPPPPPPPPDHQAALVQATRRLAAAVESVQWPLLGILVALLSIGAALWRHP
jgi:septal ring factor EnvC (AmiA/AmiB activator)